VLILAFVCLFADASFVSVPLPGAVADAQEHQAGKVYRIGFLRAGQPPATYIEGFGKACGSGDMSMARTWLSKSEPPTAASISFRALPKSWCG
jgi:hypothetical protein